MSNFYDSDSEFDARERRRIREIERKEARTAKRAAKRSFLVALVYGKKPAAPLGWTSIDTCVGEESRG